MGSAFELFFVSLKMLPSDIGIPKEIIPSIKKPIVKAKPLLVTVST
jgi:hypothetical protein